MRKGVQKLYTEVASTYEMVNHVTTFGLDVHWRKLAVKNITPANDSLWLDVCCGTGEMAQSLSRRAKSDTKIFSLDFSHAMLSHAKGKKYDGTVFFTLADAGRLPFPDETFDLVTISFSTRNLNLTQDELRRHLDEFFRILKHKGQFINLETSQPSSKILRKAFHFYVRKIVEPLGKFISGSQSGYKYLAYTIPRFYSQEDFSSLLRQTGFREIGSRPLFFGIAAIHLAQK